MSLFYLDRDGSEMYNPEMYSSVVVPCAMSCRYNHGDSMKDFERRSRDNVRVTILLMHINMQ